MESSLAKFIIYVEAAIIGYLVYITFTFILSYIATWRLIKRRKGERETHLHALESQRRYKLSAKHEEILALSTEALLAGLQSRELSASGVLEAFVAKSLVIHRELNTVTEFLSEAEAWASKLDASPEVVGPLHGLPISVKDNCNVAGVDSTIGLAKYLYKPATEDAGLVSVFKSLGAVPFVKTNVPQTLLSFGCANPVFGLTKNALNTALTPGGSSGGESSLIAAGGSRLGIGSDIGGSVRIPAHFTGIAGLKVTKGRLAGTGFRGSLPNVVGVMGVPGLLGDSAAILTSASRALLAGNLQNDVDPLAAPIPWNEPVFSSSRKLKIGYFTNLPYYPVVGDTEAVTLQAVEALKSLGHELIPFEMPDSWEMMNLVFDFCFGDGGAYLLKNWEGEPIPMSVVVNYLICKSAKWMRRILVAILSCSWIPFIASKRAISIIGRGANSTSELWDRLGARKAMTEGLLKKWKAEGLDLLLSPTFPFPAVPHNMPGRLQPSVCYTMIWNLFDFPAGVVKFGTESGKNIDSYNCQNDMVLRTGKKGCRAGIDMPISVQLIGLPYQEEIVLRGMMELEKMAPKFKLCAKHSFK